MKLTGTVKWHQSGSHGYITGHNGQHYAFHSDTVMGAQKTLKPGQPVKFTAQHSKDGNKAAAVEPHFNLLDPMGKSMDDHGDSYLHAIDFILSATKAAHERKEHSNALSHLKQAIGYADKHAKHLEMKDGAGVADRFRQDFKQHADRIVKLIERKGTKFNMDKSMDSCSHQMLKSGEACGTCGYLNKSLSIAETVTSDLLKSMSEFDMPRDFTRELLAKSVQLRNELKKAKIYSISSGKKMYDTKSSSAPDIDESHPGHLDIAHNLPQGHPARKKPMLVVGTNSWVRQLPKAHLEEHDTHLMFMPNSKPEWRLGAVTVHRKTGAARMYQSRHHDVNEGLKDLMHQVGTSKEAGHPFGETQQRHLSHTIYRMPKISLKDIQHLEPYDEKSVAAEKEENPSYEHPTLKPMKKSEILDKAKIYDFGSKKMVADLPTTESPERGFANRAVEQPKKSKQKTKDGYGNALGREVRIAHQDQIAHHAWEAGKHAAAIDYHLKNDNNPLAQDHFALRHKHVEAAKSLIENNSLAENHFKHIFYNSRKHYLGGKKAAKAPVEFKQFKKSEALDNVGNLVEKSNLDKAKLPKSPEPAGLANTRTHMVPIYNENPGGLMNKATLKRPDAGSSKGPKPSTNFKVPKPPGSSPAAPASASIKMPTVPQPQMSKGKREAVDLIKEYVGWDKMVAKLKSEGHSQASAERIAGKIKSQKYGKSLAKDGAPTPPPPPSAGAISSGFQGATGATGIKNAVGNLGKMTEGQSKIKPKLNKVYASDAQRKKFHAMEERGEISHKVVHEFDEASKGKKLPEHVKKGYDAHGTTKPSGEQDPVKQTKSPLAKDQVKLTAKQVEKPAPIQDPTSDLIPAGEVTKSLVKGDVIAFPNKKIGKKPKVSAKSKSEEPVQSGSFGPHKIGSHVVHKQYGLGRLMEVKTKEFAPGKKSTFGVVHIPDNGISKKVFVANHESLRPIVSKEEAEKVREHLKSGKVNPSMSDNTPWNRRYRDYMDTMHGGNLHEIADVHNHLNHLANEKSLNFGERKLLDSAHDRLHTEIEAATGKGLEKMLTT